MFTGKGEQWKNESSNNKITKGIKVEIIDTVAAQTTDSLNVDVVKIEFDSL